MPVDSPQVAYPDVKTWELRDKSGVTRTFEQSTLTIDGEVRLIQLATKTVQKLNEAGFPWEEVSTVINEDGSWDWNKASDLLTIAVAELPEFVAESTCILFALSPFDDDGRRNRDYDADKGFIRRSIGFTKWVEILQTFVEQNDYERLARPFGLALTRAMEIGSSIPSAQPSQSETSSPPSTSSLKQDTEETEEVFSVV